MQKQSCWPGANKDWIMEPCLPSSALRATKESYHSGRWWLLKSDLGSDYTGPYPGFNQEKVKTSSHCSEATNPQALGLPIEFRAQLNFYSLKYFFIMMRWMSFPGWRPCLFAAWVLSLRQSVLDLRRFKLDLTFLQIDYGLIQSSLNICTSLTPLKRQYFKLNSNWNMKINSQTLLGRSHHLPPLLKIFSSIKGKANLHS